MPSSACNLICRVQTIGTGTKFYESIIVGLVDSDSAETIKSETRPQSWANFSIVLNRFITAATKGEITSVSRIGKDELIDVLERRQASLNSIPQTVGDLW